MEWYVEYGGVYNIAGKKIFGRKKYVNLADFNDSVRDRFNNTDVYSTNFAYNEKDQNQSDLRGPLYIDLDGDIKDGKSYLEVRDDAIRVITFLHESLKVPKKYIQIYFSGSKGFHLLVSSKVFGITQCKDLNNKYKAIAIEANKSTITKCVDTRIYDKKRLIRLPNSINSKTGLYKIPLTEDQLRSSRYIQMLNFAKTPRKIELPEVVLVPEAKRVFDEMTKPKEVKKRENSSVINPDFEIPNCVRTLFQNGAIEGARNNTLVIIASAIMQKGTDVEDCIELMEEWNEKNEPPMNSNEIENTVRSAYRNLMDGRKYGCSSIQEIGACLGNKCKLYRR